MLIALAIALATPAAGIAASDIISIMRSNTTVTKYLTKYTKWYNDNE